MSRKRFTPEQIIHKLQEAEVLISQGMTIHEAARQIGIVNQTYYRWCKEYGGMRVDQAKRLKFLEKRIKGLNAASQSLVSTLNFKEVVERCTILAKELIGTDGAVLFLLDEGMTHLKPIVAKGPRSEEVLAVTLKLGEGITGQVAKSGQPEIVNRVDLTGRGKQVPGTPVEPESLLCSPLKMKDKTIGVITLSRLGETRFSEEDLVFLENLANISASAIGNARLYEETKKADKTKSWFLANISHEIRNPLNVMVGYTDMLRDILEGKITQKEKAHLKTIEQNAYRLMRIVNRILEYSQLETGTIKLSPRLLNLNLFIKSLIREYKPEAEEKGLQLYFESVVKNAEVMIDEISISHALSNIIDNAIKYTEKGEIRIKLTRPNKYLTLSIADTGVGISKVFVSRLFDPFSQESEGYSKKKYEGTGIGMAIVKKHLDLNNVALEINSEKGRGTTITLFFKR